MGKTDNQDTAESSQSSAAKGKRNTGKTSKLTREEALQIFQQSVLECQKTGLEVQVIPDFYANGHRYAAVLMADVTITGGNLSFVNGKEKNGQ